MNEVLFWSVQTGLSGLALGWLGGLWLMRPDGPTSNRRKWRERAKHLEADAVRAQFLGDDSAIKRAQAESMAHACLEPDQTFLERLTRRRRGA